MKKTSRNIFDFSLAKHGLTPTNLFEEVPVIIKNSNLASILLCEIEHISNITDKDSFLSLATGFVFIFLFAAINSRLQFWNFLAQTKLVNVYFYVNMFCLH